MVSFCHEWLSSWTGNNPEKLISFYHHDAVYCDPASKGYLKGHKEILAYFKHMLKHNPEWIWKLDELFPVEKGFILKWKAEIPVKETHIYEYGMDIVEIQDNLIIRNEVYFDRTQLMKTYEG